MSQEQKSKLIELYNYAYDGWGAYLEEARECLEFFLNAQWDQRTISNAKLANRTLYVYNRLLRSVNLLHGYEVKNRHILKIAPIGKEDSQACEQHTKVIMHQMGSYNGYDTMSMGFKLGPLITGSNLVEVYRDRDGVIRFGRRGYNQFLIDPSTSMIDLLDCGFYLTGQYLSDGQIRGLLPADSDKFEKIDPKGHTSSRWTVGTQYPYIVRGKARLYEELWEKSIEHRPTIIDRTTGQEVDFKEFVNAYYGGDSRRANYVIANLRSSSGAPALSKYQKAYNRVKCTYFVDGEVVYHGDNPLGIDDYNCIWMVGEWVPECDRDELKLQGYISPLRDPQVSRNRRLNQIIDILETQISTMRVIRAKYIKNIEAAFGSGQMGPVFANKDFPDTMSLDQLFYQVPGPGVPQGLFQILEALEKEEMATSGMNEEIFGTDDKEIPGILSRFRTGQALTGHAGLFQNFRSAKRSLGIKLVKINQKKTSILRVARLLNEMPAQDFKDVDEFDCVPTEGLLTDTQQQLYYQELKQLRAEFPDAAGVITLSMLLENAQVQNKKGLMDAVKKAEDGIKQQQAQMARDKQILDKLLIAKTSKELARTQEDVSDAQLAHVKTIHEIAKMDQEGAIDNLDKLIAIGQSLGLLPNSELEVKNAAVTGNKT